MKILITIVFLFFTFNSFCEDVEGNAFIDYNLNGIKDEGEKPFEGLLISNGRDIVSTDKAGNYSIESIDFQDKVKVYVNTYNLQKEETRD